MKLLTDLYYQKIKQNIPYISYEEQARMIGQAIAENKPFLGGRMGTTESYNLRMLEFGRRGKLPDAVHQLCNWSGFFPEDTSLLSRFYDLYIDAIKDIDIAVPLAPGEQAYFYKTYGGKNTGKEMKYIQGFSWAELEHPWINYLENKTLLVIHPFEDSIRKQYARIDQVFPNLKMFPDNMKLETIKAVQTIAGEVDDRFKDWFEALDYMCKETDKKEFDFAIIACGAYSLPLAHYIKKQGGRAAVIGGGLQGHFGIAGKRWEGNPFYSRHMNEFWVRPSEGETPKKFRDVEGGCYW